MLFFLLQYYLIIVLPVYCISRKSLEICSSVSQKVLRCLQPNFVSLSILPLSLIFQKMTSLGTSGRVQNRHLIKIMWQFSEFFLKFTNQLTPNLPQRLIYIKSTLSPNMTSLATSGRLLVNTHYNASRPNIFQAVWCIVKQFYSRAILSFCKDFLLLRPEMTSLQKLKC